LGIILTFEKCLNPIADLFVFVCFKTLEKLYYWCSIACRYFCIDWNKHQNISL